MSLVTPVEMVLSPSDQAQVVMLAVCSPVMEQVMETVSPAYNLVLGVWVTAMSVGVCVSVWQVCKLFRSFV